MKLFKLDFGAETRDLEVFGPAGHSGQYYDVECPFCKTRNLVYYRNFAKGVRCRRQTCRAFLYYPMHNATQDLLPKDETVLIKGLRTSIAFAEKMGGGAE